MNDQIEAPTIVDYLMTFWTPGYRLSMTFGDQGDVEGMWFPDEHMAEHDRRVAARALRTYADAIEARCGRNETAGSGGAIAWQLDCLRGRADRTESGKIDWQRDAFWEDSRKAEADPDDEFAVVVHWQTGPSKFTACCARDMHLLPRGNTITSNRAEVNCPGLENLR